MANLGQPAPIRSKMTNDDGLTQRIWAKWFENVRIVANTKLDAASDPTEDNVVIFTADGNLTDSGIDVSDVIEPSDILGTTNEITVTDNGDGTVTISLPAPLVTPGAATITGNLSVTAKLDVAEDITITELSADPSDPSEGDMVIWKSDGTDTGDDGDILYKEQSASTVTQASLKWKDFAPTSITVNASDGAPTGTVADVQVMFDGNEYIIPEDNATPGFDIEFVFSGIDRNPTFVVCRWKYDGSVTHYVTWDLWNYNTSAWDQLRVFGDSDYYQSMTMYIPQNVADDYVSAGALKVRAYHHTGGNTAHDLYVDYVGITHSLQGVI